MKPYLYLLVLCGVISNNGFAMQEGSSKSEKVAEEVSAADAQSGEERMITRREFREFSIHILCAFQALRELVEIAREETQVRIERSFLPEQKQSRKQSDYDDAMSPINKMLKYPPSYSRIFSVAFHQKRLKEKLNFAETHLAAALEAMQESRFEGPRLEK